MMTISVKVVHSISALKSSFGGPSRSVTSLCTALAKSGANVDIVTQDFYTSVDDSNIVSPSTLVDTHFAKAISLPKLRLLYSLSYQAKLKEICLKKGIQLIHDHGIWLPSNHSAACMARRLNLPLITTPRGMLEPWGMRHRAWKKFLAWSLYQHRDLQSVQLLHATALQEAENLRLLGFRQPIAIIPNGIELPPMTMPPPTKSAQRTVLFLSRIHPKKGLLTLVEAWRAVRPAGWQMVIAGPNEDNHQQAVEKAIQQAGVEEDFVFAGPVEGDAKIQLYQQADLFVLPSFSENFGIVVAEALAWGVPVITTKGTPWEDLITYRCGWWVDIGVKPLMVALKKATALTEGERQAMGQRGRHYVERFSWTYIAEQMLSVYEWVLHGSRKPECVVTTD